MTLDTLRADRVGAWGGPRGPDAGAWTPWPPAALVFDEALASVPLTLPSHATIFTGLEPPRHGVHDNGTYVVPAELETLATLLKAAGYETGAFVGAYVLDRRFGLARGFDHYDDRIVRNETGASVLESERRGEEVVGAASAWLGAALRSLLRLGASLRRARALRSALAPPGVARGAGLRRARWPTWTRVWAASWRARARAAARAGKASRSWPCSPTTANRSASTAS